MSQHFLVSHHHVGGFSTIARSRAIPPRILPCAWLAPHTADLLAHMWVTKPLTHVFETLPLVSGQWQLRCRFPIRNVQSLVDYCVAEATLQLSKPY